MLFSINDYEVENIERRAYDIRESIINMLQVAGSGHTASPLGFADIFATLYFYIMRHDPKNPNWLNRDRLIVSNGHIAPVLYATLAHAGYFKLEELLTLRKFGSRLQGHPHREALPGVETSSGPLGCGLSQAIGMALADRYIKIKPQRYFYVTMGDGEMNEGNVWEALMLLAKEKLFQVITIVDRNFIQIDGNTEEVMPLEPLQQKLESFNLHVLSIDGNDIREIVRAIKLSKQVVDKPTIIIANTIPGKGVSQFEGDYHWHGKAPNDKEAEKAILEIKSVKNQIHHNI